MRGAHAFQALQIARQDVNLQIHVPTSFQRSQCRVTGCVRNDVDRKVGAAVFGVIQIVDGQRDPVDRNRALGGDEGRDGRRRPDRDPRRAAFAESS